MTNEFGSMLERKMSFQISGLGVWINGTIIPLV